MKIVFGFLLGLAVAVGSGYIADPRDVVVNPAGHGAFALIDISRSLNRIANSLERIERGRK